MGSLKEDTCSCGHQRIDHKDTIEPGHGACIECDCPKFKWVSGRKVNPNVF